jgi:hypothetical protein
MSVTLETATLTVQESIGRVELFTEPELADVDRQLVYHFSQANYDANGVLQGQSTFGVRRVDRRFGDIAADQITSSDGTLTVTVAQLADLIKVAGYKYRQADIDAAVTP